MGTCHVFSFKEGLLSRLAHDLRIRVERFDVTIEGEGDDRKVTATFDPRSLSVETAIVDGRDAPKALSKNDHAQIEKIIQREVLHTKKHGEIRFRSKSVRETDGGLVVEGDLTLHGTTRPLRCEVRDEGETWRTAVTLHQPDFGIKPYRAALGGLRIKPDVRVELSVPK
jgi:polyisoprenoid-binding protein YceI